MTWLTYPDGTMYPVEVVARRLWSRVEVTPLAPAPDAGQTRIVQGGELS